MLCPPAADALAGLVAVAFFAVILVLLTFIMENTQRVDVSYFGVHGMARTA
jgi:uncharacterized integral membrane protein